MSSSSVAWSLATRNWPVFSNIQFTDPASPRLPPCLENRWRTSLTVRLRLSVAAWMKTATPPGP